MLLGSKGRVAFVNDAAKHRFGDWVVGQSYVSVLRQPVLLGPVEDAYFKRADGAARFVHAVGEVETTFDVRITPLAEAGDADGGAVLLVFRDRTDASAGTAVRRDFVANVSHELKTPLTAVMGLVETLQGPARDDAAARERFLATMAQELSRMSRLVSDLLSLSRVEDQLRRQPRAIVDLTGLVGEAVELLSPRAAELGVTVTFNHEGPAEILGDRDQLMQLVVNLAENALKYGSQPGTLLLAVGRIEREPVIRGPAWSLSVRDDGPGIAAVHLPRLTERFYRVDTGRSRRQGGTGLGLAIVKHIVNRHRGRMRIDSRIGVGTNVIVTLPAAQGRSSP